AARFLRDTIIGRIDEADELRALAIEQRVRALGIRARRVVPRLRIARQDVGGLECLPICVATALRTTREANGAVAAVTIGAAELDRRVQVHRAGVGLRVAGEAAGALGLHRFVGLARWRRWSCDVLALDCVLAL